MSGCGCSATVGVDRVPVPIKRCALHEAANDLLEALKAADSIMWMASEYADAGGSGGPERRDYLAVQPLITAAIAKAEGK